MARKNKLEPAEFEPQGTLIGIASSMRAFQLAHFMNKAIYIDLASTDDLKITGESGTDLEYFPLYYYYDNELRTDFYLFANSNGNAFVFPALRQMNYLLLLMGAAYDEHIRNFTREIRKIPGVQAVSLIDQTKVKNIEYFFYDFDELLRGRQEQKLPGTLL